MVVYKEWNDIHNSLGEYADRGNLQKIGLFPSNLKQETPEHAFIFRKYSYGITAEENTQTIDSYAYAWAVQLKYRMRLKLVVWTEY